MKNTLAHQIPEAIEPWWDIRLAASYLSVSVAFVRKAVRQQRIPFARAGTKNLRFRKSELDAWMKARGCDGEEGCRTQMDSNSVRGELE